MAGLLALAALLAAPCLATPGHNGPTSGEHKTRITIPGIHGKVDNGVTFIYFSRKDPLHGVPIVLGGKTRKLFDQFNPKLPTKVIVHGWLEDGVHRFGNNVKKAVLGEADLNVIVVNWSKHGSQTDYPGAAKSVVRVAEVLASFLQNLAQDHGYPLQRLHLMGHSLGAHVVGIAGSRLGGKVGRITGFDPAGVLFGPNTKDRLRPESASLVDVIHTCADKLGHLMKMGHVDFYPNGGGKQAGCTADILGICSHNRAEAYYIESLRNPKGFAAASCASWDDFQKKKCDFNKINYIGEGTDRNVQGNFFLETNTKSPFARGFSWTRRAH